MALKSEEIKKEKKYPKAPTGEINEWQPAPSLLLPALQSAFDQGSEASADPVRFVLYNVILAKAAEDETYLVFLSQLVLKLSFHVTCNCEMLSSKL